jgi:molecular chaperone GrpE
MSNQPEGRPSSKTEAESTSPAPNPDGDAPAGTDAPEDPLSEALAKAEDNWNRYLRTAAELENVRKRAARDQENARKYGVEKLAGELLIVLDSLEAGLEAGANAAVEDLLAGKEATLNLLRSALEQHGVSEVDPEGERFNPELHEAMSMQQSNTAEPGSILTVVQKGYELNGRLLRPARVIVAMEPGEPAGEQFRG